MRMQRVLAVAFVCSVLVPTTLADETRPNVILIMTDDQGYGDLGVHGNPVIETPHLDRLYGESARFRQFYVSPVCAPTRASLMTGRYNYRTGAVDTYLGRAMMYTQEVTLAEMLGAAGYRTGIFGKWHLGDNFPLRAMDQGFETALVHRGGGVGQPADPPGNAYMNPTLYRNGEPVQTEGYCSDVYTTAAMDFIAEHREEPFFVYLPFNCPHTPLETQESDLARYAEKDLSPSAYGDHPGHPVPENLDTERTAKVYAMISNIDDNIGRLLSKLDELELAKRTIVIFLTDNGPAPRRYNGGLRAQKGSVYDGGIRVPCFVRWPERLTAGHEVEAMAAHLDVVPTVLAACGVDAPADVEFDGMNVLPLLTGETTEAADRTLCFQWHRGDVPERYRACAVRAPRYKLVQPLGVQPDRWPVDYQWELYDMVADPYEETNVAAEHPEIVARLTAAYDAWYDDVSSTRGYDPPRIHIGSDREDPVTLTRQDWRGPLAGWDDGDVGHWEVDVTSAGDYRVTLRFPEVSEACRAHFSLGDVMMEQPVAQGAGSVTFVDVRLPAGPARLEAWLIQGEQTPGVHYVDLERAK